MGRLQALPLLGLLQGLVQRQAWRPRAQIAAAAAS